MIDLILKNFLKNPSFIELLESIQSGRRINRLCLPRSARLPVLASIYTHLKKPVILLTDRNDQALSLADELGFWLSKDIPLYFPEPNPLFYENAVWGDNTRRDRLIALTNLAKMHLPQKTKPKDPPVIIAPAKAVMSRTIPKHEFIKAISTLKKGIEIDLDKLVEKWVLLGYNHSPVTVSPGQFSRRGGLLDIWPHVEGLPTRIEFFGDEIDSLRSFDPSTQRTVAMQEQLVITPAREYIIKPELDTPFNDNEPSEFFIPYFHSWSSSFLDYVPNDSLIFIDDGIAFSETIDYIEEEAINNRIDGLADGTIPADFPIPYVSKDQIQDLLPPNRTIELGPVREFYSEETEKGIDLALSFLPPIRFGGQLTNLINKISLTNNHDQSLIISRQSSRIKELWEETNRLKSHLDKSTGQLFVQGSVSGGWGLQIGEDSIFHLITDAEIFGWQRPTPRKVQAPAVEAPEGLYNDLRIGSWVVHIDHGVGNYIGLVTRLIDDIEREYLCIEYAEGDQLFVPVHQADRITRFIGTESRSPHRTRLGGTSWKTTKANVKKAVERLAEDLLELYAKRDVVSGYQFSLDTAWQEELERSFPYIETEDQVRVLSEVKRDMESARPMDRLLCGDVGYGKTEVALRATFKAVMDGKQVAILVPTTVLAQQHMNTFRDRLTVYPVEVEMLSRFRTPGQQQIIIKRILRGEVDVIIGTHRLLSGDVIFKDLGLLIIDEEQRFGITHKEEIKKLRTEVDVLTMTATPIPRTLYMTLTGVRDISTINTPPEDRLPIITHVGPYDPRLVRRAISREMDRGGQVFFVHNRVQTILAMKNHLNRIVPDARISIAHGQMHESDLSKRMVQFTRGEIDVLLSTSIIESGLDIPNANTLIVDRADTFGLAQLYQLRGRVGRGGQRAYAYFFKHRKKPTSPLGKERLETIAENSHLGAGFSIAMRDLEIRGAGDILGPRQSGHISAVGFHLYTRLLSESVRRLRSQKGILSEAKKTGYRELKPLVLVDLSMDSHIPSDYVSDLDVRLSLYRRMADLDSFDEIHDFMDELIDRFGKIPISLKNLLYQLRVKILAEKIGLVSVSFENGQIVLRYPRGQLPPR
jgi:transcription-repair coupling factor (superfamily II helicase)